MMFGKVLKASGKSGKAGSSTAGNLNFQELMRENPVSSGIEIFRFAENFNRWAKQRTFSKTSNALAEAMVSDKGVDALLELAAGWKDQAKAISYLRAITLSYATTDEFMN